MKLKKSLLISLKPRSYKSSIWKKKFKSVRTRKKIKHYIVHMKNVLRLKQKYVRLSNYIRKAWIKNRSAEANTSFIKKYLQLKQDKNFFLNKLQMFNILKFAKINIRSKKRATKGVKTRYKLKQVIRKQTFNWQYKKSPYIKYNAKKIYFINSKKIPKKKASLFFVTKNVFRKQNNSRFRYTNPKAFVISSIRKTIRRLKRKHRRILAAKKPIIIRVKPLITLFEKKNHWKRDVFHNSFWFAKFINKFIKKGKKHQIEKKISKVMCLLKSETRQTSFLLFWKLLVKAKPIACTVPKRIGKIYHNIPIPIKIHRSYKLVFKWFINSVNSRDERSLTLKILNEWKDTLDERRSLTIKQRDILYLLINDNRTNSHFRWA